MPKTTNSLSCQPIGYFHGRQSEKYMAPKQSGLAIEGQGLIILCPNSNFEQALEDLKGFERIWILYWFDRNKAWKPKVTTPRGGPKRGVFATRSPHRPNPIGLSCVELLGLQGREIIIGKSDLLDGTPILDIKPYLNYADAFPDSRQGWLEDAVEHADYELAWEALAETQAQFIEQHAKYPFKDTIALRLRHNPFPAKNRRIKPLADHAFEIALKTWRVYYRIKENRVTVYEIRTGYDQDTLAGKKTSRWDDVPIHQQFSQKFPVKS